MLGFDQGGQYHKNRVWCSTAEDIFFLTNPAVIASEDAKRIAKVAAADMKNENALKNKESGAARLAAKVVPKRRAK